MPERPFSKSLLAAKKDAIQSKRMVMERNRPNADTLMEILMLQYPKAFHIIQKTEHTLLKQFGMTQPERLALEMAIQNHSYPFIWVSAQHGEKEFSTIDQLGRYFTIVFKVGKRNKISDSPRPFTEIPDKMWKF